MAKQETFVVFGIDGMIDLIASRAMFEAHLDKQVVLHEDLHRAVHVIFNRYPNNPLRVDAFERLVLNQMEIDPFNQDSVEGLVMNYVRNCPEFRVTRGRDGGVRRISDIKPDEKK